MDGDQYSLDKLRGIVIPDPPPFWPPAPGMWVALGVVLFVVLLAGWLVRRSWQRNAYRRAGLLLLGGARTAHEVSVVLKRVALAAFPREQVASLYGDDWAAFLHKTCPDEDFAVVTSTDAGTMTAQAFVGLASIWIRNHRVPGAE